MNAQSKSAGKSSSKSISTPGRIALTWRNSTDNVVYEILKTLGPQTRSDLVERSGLPRTTIFDALTRLTIRGVIVRFSEPRQTRGRPRVFYEVIS